MLDQKKRKLGWRLALPIGAAIVAVLGVTAYASQGLVQDRRVSMLQAQEMAKAAQKTSEFPVVVNDRVLKWLTPIDDSEDSILVCGSDMSWCKQTCISIYRPVTRWSTFQSSWLSPSGKCVGAAMSYSDGATIPRFKYWIGTFVFNSGSSVLGHCSFNLGSPDFEGKAYFDFVRGAPSYYVQNFFDLSENAVSNMQLLTFNPPGIYSYHDSSVSNSDITLQLTKSGGCVKEANIGNTFQ